jgi:uncharacterized protein (DUF2062 family)
MAELDGPTAFSPTTLADAPQGRFPGGGIGVFFAFLIPIAQIPLAAVLSMWLRANIPAAALATIVNNPLTFPPVYYAAWELGRWILSLAQHDASALEKGDNQGSALSTGLSEVSQGGTSGWFDLIVGHMDSIGKPMALGALIFACVFSVLGYVLVQLVWIRRVRRRRSNRLLGNRP